MNKQLENVDSKYGAPMGRPNSPGDHDAPLKFRLFRVNVDSGGYDDGGAYWGQGAPLYCAEAAPVWDESMGLDCDGARHFMRARDSSEAAAIILNDYPNASFIQSDIAETQLQEFTAGYIAALLWSSTDIADEYENEITHLDDYELSTAGADSCRADCRAFFQANAADIHAAAEVYPAREEHGGYSLAGHDFALTRNGHGAGFWDGDLPDDLGERLTAASKKAGEVFPYLGDDGAVYL